MKGSIAAELLVLRKRSSTWILLGIWAGLSVLYGYLLPYIAYSDNAAKLPPGLRNVALTNLLPQQIVGNLIGGFPFYGGAIVLILGVLSLGSEYGWGTLKTLFTQRPGRLQVFTVKLIVVGIALVPFVLAVFAIGALASTVIAQREQAVVTWPSAWLLVQGFVGAWFILAVWAALGVMLAALSRGTALAIGIGILYALAIEGLISAFANESSLLRPLTKVLLRANFYSLIKPLSTSSSAAGNGPGAFPGPFVGSAQALVVLVVYFAAFLLIATTLLRRRDVA